MGRLVGWALALWWLTLSAACGAPARVVITYTTPGAVYLSPEGKAEYTRVADRSPATIEAQAGFYDVRVEGNADLFHIWRGDLTRIAVPNSVPYAVNMHRELAWSRVTLCLLAVVGACLALLRRARVHSRTLEGELQAEKAYGEMRPGALPRRIGAYRVLARLGAGGMACVYKVEDEGGGVYALKVPDERLLDDENGVKRFLREMKIGESLHHPGIVRIFEVHEGDATTRPYIAQELLGGQTLRAVIDSEGPLDEARSIEIVRQLTEALRYAHERGVIHRDVKPANIMIGKKDRVHMMDFGIAKATALETMTGTDTTLGTPDYMAPEQIESRAATVQSDLYSVGVVLFEMLTKTLPYVDQDAYRLLVRKMRETPPRVSDLRPDVSRRLDNLVAMLLSADLTRRPASAEQLGRMLELI